MLHRQRAVTDQVAQPAGRGDDEVEAAAQLADATLLVVLRLPAEHAHRRAAERLAHAAPPPRFAARARASARAPRRAAAAAGPAAATAHLVDGPEKRQQEAERLARARLRDARSRRARRARWAATAPGLRTAPCLAFVVKVFEHGAWQRLDTLHGIDALDVRKKFITGVVSSPFSDPCSVILCCSR